LSKYLDSDPDPQIHISNKSGLLKEKKIISHKTGLFLLDDSKDLEPDPYLILTDTDPGGPKTYGSGSPTLVPRYRILDTNFKIIGLCGRRVRACTDGVVPPAAQLSPAAAQLSPAAAQLSPAARQPHQSLGQVPPPRRQLLQ
jgi:hypothetical protein